MNKIPRIVFVYKNLSPFIRDDLDILQKHFTVYSIQWKGYLNLTGFWKLVRTIKKSDIVFTWFENYRSAFTGIIAKLLKKKMVLVSAGAITLGAEWKNQKQFVKFSSFPGVYYASKTSVKLADTVLAVSEYKKRGLLKHVATDNIKVVPNCFNINKYIPAGDKENTILTVSFLDKTNYERKGLHMFLEAARHIPDAKFIILGEDIDGTGRKLMKMAIDNLEVITDFEKKDIVKYMQRSKAYAQLSSMESFGAALAEAMLCECVPAITQRGFMPELVGDTGFYCEFGNIESTVKAINQALDSNNGKLARQRVKTLFPLEKREKMVVEILKDISESNIDS